MIELYEFPLSGNCHKVRLVLSLLGLEYRSISLRGAEGEHKQPAFLALNPFVQVPVLVDSGFAYEWRDDSGHWFGSYGNENRAFDENGLMRRRYASINDLPITEAERKFHWPLGRRPDDHSGLSGLG